MVVLRLGIFAFVTALVALTRDTVAFTKTTTNTKNPSLSQKKFQSLTFVSSQQSSHDQAKLLALPFVTGSGATGKLFASSSSSSSLTQLNMGKMEEFLTGRDDKQRKANNDKYLAELQKRVDRMNTLEADIEELGDEELTAKTEEFKARLKKGEDLNGPMLEECFAVVREAAW